MEFPGRSKKYSDNLSQINKTESAPVYIAVPGPQGEKGPKGDTGDKGKDGRQGPKGDPGNPGKDGRNGLNGKPGIDGITKSGQKPGWAVYDNLNKKYIRTGATKGNDGWVQFSSDCLGPLTNENYLPENNVSLYNKLTQRINLKGLKVGSIITIRYDISLVTFSNNTEVWLRTFIPGHDKHPTIFIGNLKYQFDYDLSLEHTFFLENETMKKDGAFPEILTDADADLSVRSIYISIR